MDGTNVPVVDCGRDSVHSVDLFHEWGGDSSWEEIDEGVFVGDFAEGDIDVPRMGQRSAKIGDLSVNPMWF